LGDVAGHSGPSHGRGKRFESWEAREKSLGGGGVLEEKDVGEAAFR